MPLVPKAGPVAAALAVSPTAGRDELLLRLPRGESSEIRITCQKEGEPFLSIRQWALSSAGAFFPTTGGVVIRPEELEAFAAAVARAQELAADVPTSKEETDHAHT